MAASIAQPRDRALSPLLERGAPLGRYLVVELVGRGAMGDVYAAYDPELDRKVAVKLLQIPDGEKGDIGEQKARLLREAQAIARLSHPNVVVVHDVGSFGERVFIAMEFVDGHTLTYWLHAARLGAGARLSTCSFRRGAGWRRRTPPISCTATSRAKT